MLASPSCSPYIPHPLISHLPDIRVSQAVKDVRASYDALVDFFASFENILSRLGIYTEIPLTQEIKTQAMEKVLVEIILGLLSALALATQQVKQGRFGEFVLSVALAGVALD